MQNETVIGKTNEKKPGNKEAAATAVERLAYPVCVSSAALNFFRQVQNRFGRVRPALVQHVTLTPHHSDRNTDQPFGRQDRSCVLST